MPELTILSPSEQVATHLRTELQQGRWSGTMPGAPALATELGVDGKTVWAALGLLEEEGLLVSQGTGRPRRISMPESPAPPTLRVGILDYDPVSQNVDYMIDLRHRLASAGHHPFFTRKTLIELKMDTRRVARLISQTSADAWIVCSASSDVLSWMATLETPAFALFGRRAGLPIAGVGPDHVTACRMATRRLIDLGHQRIVVLVRESQRSGGIGAPERAIFEEMANHGLPFGPYNLPVWEDSSEGLHSVVDELLRVTPPTAIFVDEAFIFHAVRDHLAQHGILAPDHVSLICADSDPTFAWCKPSVAHIEWDINPVVSRIVRWAGNVARGRLDIRQPLTEAVFVEGGTIGPAPPGM